MDSIQQLKFYVTVTFILALLNLTFSHKAYAYPVSATIPVSYVSSGSSNVATVGTGLNNLVAAAGATGTAIRNASVSVASGVASYLQQALIQAGKVQIPISIAQTASKAAVAAMIAKNANLVGLALTGMVAGMALYDYLNSAGLNITKDGIPQIMPIPQYTPYTYKVGQTGHFFNDASSAMNDLVNYVYTSDKCSSANGTVGCPDGVSSVDDSSPAQLVFQMTSGAQSFPTAWYISKTPSTYCPTGYTYLSSQAICNLNPGAAYFQNTDVPSFQSRLSQAPGSLSAPLLKQLDDAGVQAVPDGAPQITAPSSVTEPTTKTVNPDNSVTSTQSTINVSVSGPNITMTENKTVTNTTASGASTATSVSSAPDLPAPVSVVSDLTHPNTVTGSGSSASSPAAASSQTDCDKYPDHIGCSDYGSAPPADVLTNTPVDTSLSPTSWGSGSCPAPRALGLSSSTLSMSYQPVCDFMGYMRPILLAIGWLSAFGIVIGGVRE